MDVSTYYNQGEVVEASVDNFVINVLAALAIVIITLLIFMGLRSAIVIGFILLLTIAATLLTMKLMGIPMHRISLGALIIALGMMVEVPAAALRIHAFAVDFYSVGSNDLIQFVTAACRDCAEVAALYDPLNPAVLELIRRVAVYGAATDKEVSLCGDMAADPECIPAILDVGIKCLSVAPAALAKVKEAVSQYGKGYG